MPNDLPFAEAIRILIHHGFHEAAHKVSIAASAIAELERAAGGDPEFIPTETTPGGRLREARRFRGMTMEQLGETAGFAKVSVHSHERALRAMSMDVVTAYAKALNVAPQSIMFG